MPASPIDPPAQNPYRGHVIYRVIRLFRSYLNEQPSQWLLLTLNERSQHLSFDLGPTLGSLSYDTVSRLIAVALPGLLGTIGLLGPLGSLDIFARASIQDVVGTELSLRTRCNLSVDLELPVANERTTPPPLFAFRDGSIEV